MADDVIQTTMARPVSVFTPFNLDDDIVTEVPSRVTYGLWSDGSGILTGMSTSSVADASIKKYYHDVYGSGATGSAAVEFSIAYGHVSGSGSDVSDRDNSTQAIYGQYRSLLLANPNGSFITIDGTKTLTDFIAINIKRSNLKQKLDAGNWQLNLTSTVSGTHYLIDNSGGAEDTNISTVGNVLAVVSGTVVGGEVAAGALANKEYGLCYPEYGIILLDPRRISESLCPFDYNTASDAYYDNHGKLFGKMSGSAAVCYFEARSEEIISSTHYFVRLKNKQYNYTTNPTFYSASDGTIIYSEFYDNPEVYVTSIGLYNNSNELVAVAKTSQPIKKSFSLESLFSVRLDF